MLGRHILALFLIVFVLCYSPVLLTPYAFSDDYTILAQALQGKTEVSAMQIAQGRPAGALLTRLAFSSIRDIGEVRYLRLVSVLGITLVAWSLYRTLVLTGWSWASSLFLSVIICTLPPFQVYAAWATAAFLPFAAWIAGGAFALAERAWGEPRSWYKWGLTACSILLVLLALTIYQPAAMFFWVFAAIVLLQPDITLPQILRRFLWYSVIAGSGLLLGFGVYKLGLALYGPDSLSPLRSHLTPDISEKALWFVCEPLRVALKVTQIAAKRWLAWSVAGFILSGLLVYFRGKLQERLGKLLIALVLLPLSYLPDLVVAESVSYYRTLSALTALIVVYACLVLWGYERACRRPATAVASTAILGLAALASSFLAAHNVSLYFASPQLQELQFLRRQLAQAEIAQVRSISIIGSTWKHSLAPTVRYGEFGMPSSASPWVPKPMVYLVLRELSPEHANLPIEFIPADHPVEPPRNALVVDMRKLVSLRCKAP